MLVLIIGGAMYDDGYFTVELTVVISFVIILVFVTMVLFSNQLKKLEYTNDDLLYEKAFSKKIEEIRMQKIMREIR